MASQAAITSAGGHTMSDYREITITIETRDDEPDIDLMSALGYFAEIVAAGTDGPYRMTNEAIGEQYGVSGQAISKTRRGAQRKLKQLLEGGDTT